MSWLNDGSAKLILPVCGVGLAVGQDQLDLEVLVLRQDQLRPSAQSLAAVAIWFCETLKFTQIGSTAAT